MPRIAFVVFVIFACLFIIGSLSKKPEADYRDPFNITPFELHKNASGVFLCDIVDGPDRKKLIVVEVLYTTASMSKKAVVGQEVPGASDWPLERDDVGQRIVVVNRRGEADNLMNVVDGRVLAMGHRSVQEVKDMLNPSAVTEESQKDGRSQ